MNEIYWLVVLGNLHALVGLILGLSFIVLITAPLIYVFEDAPEIRSKLPGFFAKILA